jgi:hypothetical protein
MKKIITVLVFLLATSLLVPPKTFAQNSLQQKGKQKTVIVASDETINKNPYFAAGDVVEIHGTINGDAYVAGGEVIIDGTINGDLFVAGGSVRVSGKVGQSLRAAGGQLTVDADVGRNATVVGGNLSIEKSAILNGYLATAGGNITITAPVSGNLKVAGGNVSVLSSVGGDLDAAVGMLRLGPEASVAGNLTYLSDQSATIDNNASVEGEIIKRTPPPGVTVEEPEKFAAAFAKLRVAAKIISAIAAFIVGLILIKLFPKYMSKTKDVLDKKVWRALGIGFLVLILTPIAIVVLLMTVIGIPLALLLGALYLIYVYLSKIAVIYWAGAKMFPKSSPVAFFVLALLIYALVTLIPFIGGLVEFFVLLFGLGAMVISCTDIYNASKKAKLV